MKKFFISALIVSALMSFAQAQEVYKMKDLNPPTIGQYDPNALSLKVSANDFKTTLQKAQDLIKKQKIKLFVILDHSAAASEFKQTLPPTSVIVFGNPASGTLTMQKYPNVAVELPMKVLIYERDHKVFVGFIKPTFWAKALGFKVDDAFIQGTQKAYEDFTNAITN